MMHVEEIAEVCHEANRVLQRINGEDVSPPWSGAAGWVRDSARSGVLSALSGSSPEELHAAWSREKTELGWVYGPRKDGIAKTHPCLVPYDDLPDAQKRKDFLFGAIVRSLTEAM